MEKTYIFNKKYSTDITKLSRRLSLIENIDVKTEKGSDSVVLKININSQKEETFDNLVVLIGSFVLTIYKTDYVTKNLVVTALLQNCMSSLIVSMVAFDYEAELLFVSNLLSDYDKLYVESFNMFCMDELRIKWNEFLFVINTTLKLENRDGFIELIKFLSDNINGINEINLHIVSGKIMLCDHNQNVLEKDIDINDPITLITTLANHSPKVINVHNLSVLGKQNYKILNYVFPNKLNTLV